MSHRVIAFGVALSLCGCGASQWVKAIESASKYQEETVEAQKAATDELVKLGYLACNGWSVRYGAKAQAVLDARAEDARGVVGAAAKVSKAEADASATEDFFTDYCALAKKAAAKFGVPLVAPVPQPASSPAPVSPPTGGPAPVPAVSVPAASPAVPPVGVPSQPAGTS